MTTALASGDFFAPHAQPVGAGLLAKAAVQALMCRLLHSFRQQAGSRRGSVFGVTTMRVE